VAILWAGCKDRDSCVIPNVTTHNSSSQSDSTVTKQESTAEPPSTNLDSATTDSQSVVSEATKYRDRSKFFGSGSHTTENTDELPSSIENCMEELEDIASFHSAGSYTTGNTDELLISIENCM
jgi:hypothetical protein